MQQNDLVKFDHLKHEIAEFTKTAKEVVVSDNETMERGLSVARQVKELAQRIELRRKELVSPYNNQVKSINDYAKVLANPLDEAQRHIKGQLSTWEQKLELDRRRERERLEAEQKRIRDEERKRQDEARKKADFVKQFDEDEAKRMEIVENADSEAKALEIRRDEKAAMAAVDQMKVRGAQKVWKFEVTAAAEVPREFTSVDEKKIREAVKNGVREIPGVRIYEDIAIAIR